MAVVYKVVSKKGAKLYSAMRGFPFLSQTFKGKISKLKHKGILLEYFVDEQVVAVEEHPILAFATLDSAYSFIDHNMDDSACIYKCDAIFSMYRPNKLSITDIVAKTTLSTKKVPVFCGWPNGTVFCDSIILRERITI